jgi:phage terminase small subunit
MAFASLCTAWATLRRINIAFTKAKYGVLAEKHSFLEQKSEEGRSNEVMAVELKANPLIVQQRLALQTVRFWCNEFGATPSSRGRISVPGIPDPDPDEEFLHGR